MKIKTPKVPLFGNNRSKALNSTPRRWNLNLQKYTLFDPKTTKKVTFYLSAKQLKTLRRQHFSKHST